MGEQEISLKAVGAYPRVRPVIMFTVYVDRHMGLSLQYHFKLNR